MSGLDLYQTQRALALLFVYSAVLGFGLGALYDLLRFLRVFCGEKLTGSEQGSRRPLTAVIRFLGDLVFSLATAVSLILLCYYANDGQFRASALWGMVGGFFVYMQTVGRLTVRALPHITRKLKQGIRWLCRGVLRPVLWVGSLVARAAERIVSLTVGKLLRKKREERTKRMTESLLLLAGQGFGIMNSDGKNTDGKTVQNRDRSE